MTTPKTGPKRRPVKLDPAERRKRELAAHDEWVRGCIREKAMKAYAERDAKTVRSRNIPKAVKKPPK